jgi:hypothetical protein
MEEHRHHQNASEAPKSGGIFFCFTSQIILKSMLIEHLERMAIIADNRTPDLRFR